MANELFATFVNGNGRDAVMEHIELAGCALAQVYGVGLKCAPVIDADIYHAVIFVIHDFEHGIEGQFAMGGCKAIWIVNFFVFGEFSFESGAVPAGRTTLEFLAAYALGSVGLGRGQENSP